MGGHTKLFSWPHPLIIICECVDYETKINVEVSDRVDQKSFSFFD